MKIGIDTLGCEAGRSEAGSYLISFVKGLASFLGREGKEVAEAELFGLDADKYAFAPGDTAAVIPFCAVDAGEEIGRLRFWHSIFASSFIRRRGYDAVIYASHLIPPPARRGVPSVLLLNEPYSDLSSRFVRGSDAVSWLRSTVSRASRVIVPSMYAKRSLSKARIRDKKVEVVHCGVDHDMFFPPADNPAGTGVADVRPFMIKKPYLVCAEASDDAADRLPRIIEGFTLFKKAHGGDLRLIITGEYRASDVRRLQTVILKSSARDDIFLTGYFPYEGLPTLYRDAQACVFPSADATPGRSVLEAMATALPSACASGGQAVEISGGNAVLFDANDAEDVLRAIEEITLNEALRGRLAGNGVAWARKFSWERSADDTLAIIKQDVIRLRGSADRRGAAPAPSGS